MSEYNKAQTSVPMSNAANLFELNYALGGYTQAVNDTLTGSTTVTNQTQLASSAKYSNSVAAMA